MTDTDAGTAGAKKKSKPNTDAGTAGAKVTVRITRFGDGKVSSGKHVPAEGDVMLAEGDTVSVDQVTADALEERGLAEIQ